MPISDFTNQDNVESMCETVTDLTRDAFNTLTLKLDDHLTDIPVQVTVEVEAVHKLTVDILRDCLMILDQNLGSYYQARAKKKPKKKGSRGGGKVDWRIGKLDEMQESGLVYVILRSRSRDRVQGEKNQDHGHGQGDMVGFMSFLCCQEENDLVIYIYEIQLTSILRGHGIGSKLFEIIMQELIPMLNNKFDVKFNGIMLTCFNDNTKALKFYRQHQGFKLADHSPIDDDNHEDEQRLRSGNVMVKTKSPSYYILHKPCINVK